MCSAGNLVDELDATLRLGMWVAAGRPSRARRLYEQAAARRGMDCGRRGARVTCRLRQRTRFTRRMAPAPSTAQTPATAYSTP